MSPTSESHNHQSPTLIALAALALLGLQGFYISQGFDAYILVMDERVTGWRSTFGQLGNVLKIAVVSLVLAGLLLKDRLPEHWRTLSSHLEWRRFGLFLVPHLLAFAALLWLTRRIFSDSAQAASLPAALFLLWLLAALASLVLWLLMLAPLRFYRDFLALEVRLLALALAVGFAVWLVAMYTRELWGPLSELTFVLSALLLYAVYPDLVAVYPDDKILGLGDFMVNIAPACSGYEGVGLVCAFITVYIFVNRPRVRLPQILLLYPVGALIIWLLNVVRIAVLISIGYHWSPEVAVGGFHSYAGWITFIATSLGLLWLAGNSGFFTRQEATAPSGASANTNLAIATLIPMVTLLAVALLTSAFTGGFNWLYPVRVVAVLIALYAVWPQLQLLPYRPRMEAALAGLACAVIWALMLGRSPEADAAFQATLETAPGGWVALWLGFRFVGASLTVPIAEELAFRAYILCRLSRTEVVTQGRLPLSLIAVVLSSLAFGALHGAWLAGTIAGLIYAVVRLRSNHIGDAILAHGITNAALFAYAAGTGVWTVL